MSNDQGTLSRPYISPQGKAKKATIALCILGVIALISIWSQFSEIRLAQTVANGATISEAQAIANDARQGLISIIYFICFATTGILFLRWEVRAYANLEEIGNSYTISTTFKVVMCWFIPILSLRFPYMHIRELWAKSHPDNTESEAVQECRMSKLILPWWLIWLVGYIPLIGLNALNYDYSTPEQIITWNYLSIIANILLIAALPMIILLIKQITTNQETKAGNTSSTSPRPTPNLYPQANWPQSPAPIPQQFPQRNTWQTNAHDKVPLNPRIPVLDALVIPATLHAGHSGPITQFSASGNDQPIRLSTEYRHHQPVETPGQLDFWYVVIREDNTLYLDEKITVNVEAGSTGYVVTGPYIWTPEQPLPQPGRYRVYVYEDTNKIAQTEWEVLD